MDSQSKRSGLTLIETLVSMTIVGIIVAILLPAVQSVRESARKTQCQNNLKQTALALHAFHNANRTLPSPYNGTSLSYPLNQADLHHMHSWRAALLPDLEQSSLRDAIDWQVLATDRENMAVATTIVSHYVCPSGVTPSENMGWTWTHPSQSQGDKYRVVRSDYDALAGIWVIPEVLPSNGRDGDTRYLRWGVWGLATFDNGTINGELNRYRQGKFRDVSDGLSNTIMIVERGGRPLHMVDGRRTVSAFRSNADYNGQNGWSASNSFQRRINARDVGVNHDNERGIYSDHVGGAYVALADGSVTFLSDSTDIPTLAKMIGKFDRDP